MKQTLQLFLLMLCGGLCLRSHAQVGPPEILYLRAVPSVSGCPGSEANDVIAIWSNSSQNLTVTRTFYTSADCGGEPSLTSTFEITPLGLTTPVTLKITLPAGMQSCKFYVVSQSNVNSSLCIPLTVTPAPPRLYVNALASGANTGLTWADAFTDLQSALSYPCSSNLTEIWVASGTYKPTADASGNTSPADARTKTFVMKNGVAIYGGFNGTETQLTARNWRSNPTILSGNIGDTGIDTDNSYRVINNNFTSGSPLGNTAILDGFIVEKGYANGGFPFNLGGGMWNAYASPKVQNCVFRNNYATSGGGMFNDNSSSNITNCLFFNNTATTAGSGISNGGGTDMVKVINCTFYGNTGPTTIINERPATSISNSIVWGNGGGISGGTVTYSNVQGGVSGTGNVNSDPRFENAVGGDFRLQQCSPAIDAGTNTNAPASDFAGNARPFNATGVNNTDMGAHEYQSSYSVCNCIGNNGIVYVNASASGNNSGRSWADAYTDLQSALNGARNVPACVSQIWVAAGTYKPTADASGNMSPADARMKSFVMVNGVAIYGGFNGTETQLTARNWRSNPTILSGNIGDTGIDTDNSYRVINNTFTSDSPLGNTAILDGFIVEKGYANVSPSNLGGGMWNSNASPLVRNCVFRNNFAAAGGGMFNANAQPTIENCLFLNNSVSVEGSALSNGGGTNQAKVVNCTFYGNTGSTITINNQSSAAITNCIVWGNGGGISGGTVTYSNVQGGVSGTGNVNSDPRFENAVGGDFRLQQCSPAIDAGTATNVPITDFEGNNRVDAVTVGGVVDMGAYEYQGTYDICSACANTTRGIVYVNASASGNNSGRSWANAFTDLQSALTLARNYPSCVSQIWVAAGTYKPTSGTDQGISFSMVNGVAIYGGFPNDGSGTMANRNWNINPTILSGNIGDVGKNTDNSYRIIFNNGGGLNNAAILDGFTIQDAYNPSIGNGNEGGGIRNVNCSPLFRNCIIRNNFSNQNGGGVYARGSSPVFINCVFVRNQARAVGGAVLVEVGTYSFVNCIFYENSSISLNSGGLSSNRTTTTVVLSNSILWGNFWGNQPASLSNQIDCPDEAPQVSHSIVQGGYSGAGNLSTDPLFVNASGDNFRLQQCSPAIDAGTSTDAPTTDLDGNNRVDAIAGSGVVDMGAYEYQSTYDVCSSCIGNNGIVYVNASASGGNSGRSWADAFTDLQSALSVARANPSCVSQIWVAAGTYKPTSGTDRGISFSMVNGVAIYGGFPNDGSGTMANRNWATNPTILSGDLNGDDTFTGTGTNLVIGNVSDNSYIVIRNGNTTDNTARLDGFIVSGGNRSNPSLGGGVFNDGRNGICNPVFVNCVFRHNLNYNSGAVTNNGDNGTCNPIFTHCLFYQNQAIYNGNISDGGAMFCQGNVTTVVTHCTFSQNKVLGHGGAIYASNNSGSPNVTLHNCILWDNTAVNGGNQIHLDGSTLNLNHTLLQGGTESIGTFFTSTITINNNGGLLNASPLFMDATNGNFRLQACSPAINAGDPATTSTTVGSVDLAGNPRFYNNGRIDIGAYEYQGTFDAVAPIAQVTNSTCTTVGGIPSGGVISAPSGSCPAGSSLYYSTDNGGNWSTTVPTYAQSGPAQTILTRCTCDTNPASFSPTSTVTTVPGTCPACPDLTATAPAVQVTNSVCSTYGGTASGGVISVPSGSCPAGSILQYSTDNGGNWSTTLPIYAQTGPAQHQ